MSTLHLSLVSPVGMIIVAAVSVIWFRRVTRAPYRWLWIGAVLWTVAVALKFAIAIPLNGPVVLFLKNHLAYGAYVAVGGLFIGLESSLTEIGLTLVAVMIWKQFGRDAGKAIGIGLGAGAFEALLLGVSALVGIGVALAAEGEARELVQAQIDATARHTPVFWILGPVERMIAILAHTSSRALVLLGFTRKKVGMILGGFFIFTLLDGVAGAVHVSGKMGAFSMWWVELALLPFALISIPIIRWCWKQYGEKSESQNPTYETNSKFE